MANISLMDLPSEMLLSIAQCLDSIAAISNFARTNRRLFALLESYLYQFDVTTADNGRCKALVGAVLQNTLNSDERVRIAQKSIRAGANVNFEVLMNPAFKRELESETKSEFDEKSDRFTLHDWITIRLFGTVVGAAAERFIRHNWRTERQTGTVVGAAAASGCIPLIQTLMDAGADISSFSSSGISALWCAVSRGRTDAFEFLVDQPGIDLNMRESRVNGLLHTAVLFSSLDIARILLPLWYRNYNSYYYNNLLWLAVGIQDYEMVALLLSQPDLPFDDLHPGVQRLGRISEGYTYGATFSFACALPNLEIVKLLHDDSRVDVNLYPLDFIPPIGSAINSAIGRAMAANRDENVSFLIQSTKCKVVRPYAFRKACADRNTKLAKEALQAADDHDRKHAKKWIGVAKKYDLNEIITLIRAKWSDL